MKKKWTSDMLELNNIALRKIRQAQQDKRCTILSHEAHEVPSSLVDRERKQTGDSQYKEGAGAA